MRLYGLACCLTLAVLILSVTFYCVRPKGTAVFLNHEALYGEFIRQLAELNATKEQIESTTRRFNDALNQVVTQYAEINHAVILRELSVLAGSRDITDEVRLQLSEVMREKP